MRFPKLSLPEAKPSDSPREEICLNSEWVRWMISLCERLEFDTAWAQPFDETDKLAKVLELTDIFVRARPNMGCCCDDASGDIFRFDEDGDYQVSHDGGATWEDVTSGDPRHDAILFPPLPGDDGDDKRCRGATNATAQLKNDADALAADAGAWGNITQLIAALLAILVFIGIIGSGGALTPLLIGLAGVLLSAGQAAFAAAMTADVYDTLNCILYCYISPDASFTDEAIKGISARLSTDLSGIAADYLSKRVIILGAKGLTNAARTADAREFDCSTCVCSECPCDIFLWNWSPAYGTPAAAAFNRNPETCSLTADNLYHDPVSGLYYFGVSAPTGCTMAAGIVSGSVNVFHGYIPSTHTGSFSWFDTSANWLPGIIPGPRDCKAIIMVSTVPFLPYAVMA